MANDNTHTYLLSDARKALNEHRLLMALQSIQGLATFLKASSESEEVESLLASYNMLLSYMIQGADDPEREKMYQQFVRRAYELTDNLERKGELSDPTSFYTVSQKYLEKLLGGSYSLTQLLRTNTDLRTLFDAVWLSGSLSSTDETLLSDYVASTDENSEGRLLVISALTLSTMRFFDIAKYRILLDASLSMDVAMRVRALTGVVFVTMSHADRLVLYPEIEARLQLMSDVKGFRTELEMLQTQLLLSLETKRIERNLREEILPQMMKNIENLRIDKSLGIENIKEKLSEADFNPEWGDDNSAAKLEKSMHEFMELQQRGADMYMSSFKMLKQRFPFFRVVSNWFWPFTLNHPDINEQTRENDMLKILLRGAGLCDSDKFSFCLVIQSMPDASKSTIATTLKNNMPEEMQQLIDSGKSTQEISFKQQMRSYVQGFYRFCNLFIHHKDFVNPFSNNIFIFDYYPFNHILNQSDFLTRMADFAFKDKTYQLALNLYERVERKDRSAGVCQRLGYCYEKDEKINQAIDSYELANALKPNSEWTLNRIASCYRKIENYTEALKTYNELATLRTEDTNLSLHQAECLIHLERFEEAFKYLYKADYLAPDTSIALRALAWCSLLTAKYEQAERYYTKVLHNNPSSSDWLNAGHVAWLQGNISEAVKRYRKSITLQNDNQNNEECANFLDADTKMLLRAGLTTEDIAIMNDAVFSDV